MEERVCASAYEVCLRVLCLSLSKSQFHHLRDVAASLCPHPPPPVSMLLRSGNGHHNPQHNHNQLTDDKSHCTHQEENILSQDGLTYNNKLLIGQAVIGSVHSVGTHVDGVSVGRLVSGIVGPGVTLRETPQREGEGEGLFIYIDYQSIVEFPESALRCLSLPSVAGILKPLCDSLICNHRFLRVAQDETAAIMACTLIDALFLIQWIPSASFILVYLPKEEIESSKESVNDHPFFQHPSNLLWKNKIRVKNMDEGMGPMSLGMDVLDESGDTGVSVVVVCYGVMKLIVKQHTQCEVMRGLIACLAPMGRLVCMDVCDEVDGVECRGLYAKSSTLSFFSPHTLIMCDSAHGSILHYLIEVTSSICGGKVWVPPTDLVTKFPVSQVKEGIDYLTNNPSRIVACCDNR
eukprot:GHVQ01002643.1.p2 GENE.GHVQ01002643.1~~GHVQ01002643.1.p2  ORF type:complete len:406 (-),score=51.34 GHVQ01002643.1:2165-3382(-)